MSEELKLINSLQSSEVKYCSSALLAEFERKKKEISERLKSSTATKIFTDDDINAQLLKIYLKALKVHLQLLLEKLRLYKKQLIYKTTHPLENIPLASAYQT